MTSPIEGIEAEVVLSEFQGRARAWLVAVKHNGGPARQDFISMSSMSTEAKLELWFVASFGISLTLQKGRAAAFSKYLLSQPAAQIIHETCEHSGVHPDYGVLVGVGGKHALLCRDGVTRVLDAENPDWAPVLHKWSPLMTTPEARLLLQDFTEAVTRAWGARGKLLLGWMFAAPHCGIVQSMCSGYPTAAIMGADECLAWSMMELTGMTGRPVPDGRWTGYQVARTAKSCLGFPMFVLDAAPQRTGTRPACRINGATTGRADVHVMTDEVQQDYAAAARSMAPGARLAYLTFAHRADDHAERFRATLTAYLAGGAPKERAVCMAGLTVVTRHEQDGLIQDMGTATKPPPFVESLAALMKMLLEGQKLPAFSFRRYARHGCARVGINLPLFARAAAEVSGENAETLRLHLAENLKKCGTELDRTSMYMRFGDEARNLPVYGLTEEMFPRDVLDLMDREYARLGGLIKA